MNEKKEMSEESRFENLIIALVILSIVVIVLVVATLSRGSKLHDEYIKVEMLSCEYDLDVQLTPRGYEVFTEVPVYLDNDQLGIFLDCYSGQNLSVVTAKENLVLNGDRYIYWFETYVIEAGEYDIYFSNHGNHITYVFEPGQVTEASWDGVSVK